MARVAPQHDTASGGDTSVGSAQSGDEESMLESGGTSVAAGESRKKVASRMLLMGAALTFPAMVTLAFLTFSIDKSRARFLGFRVTILGFMAGIMMGYTAHKATVVWTGVTGNLARTCGQILAVGVVNGGMWAVASMLLGYYVLSEYHPSIQIAGWAIGHVFAGAALLLLWLPSQATTQLALLCMTLLALFMQICFSMTFGEFFLNGGITESQKVLMCAGYPLAILVFKVIQRLTLEASLGNAHRVSAAATDLVQVVDFASLSFAGLPYRVIFLGLSNWTTMLLVLLVEALFKTVAYPVQMTGLFLQFKHRVRTVLTCSGQQPQCEEEAEGGALTEETTAAQIALSRKFFWHSLIDTWSVFGTVGILLFLRLRDNPGPVSTKSMSDTAFERLVTQFAVAIVFELVFTLGVYAAVRYVLQRRHFEPVGHSHHHVGGNVVVFGLIVLISYLVVFGFGVDVAELPT